MAEVDPAKLAPVEPVTLAAYMDTKGSGITGRAFSAQRTTGPAEPAFYDEATSLYCSEVVYGFALPVVEGLRRAIEQTTNQGNGV